MLFLNQRGLSTVELLITLGFLGAVVYGGISVLEKQKSQIIEANQEIQMTTITHELRELLQKRPLCQRSLQGHKPNTTSGDITDFYQRQAGTLTTSNSWVKAYSHEQIQEQTKGPAQLGLESYVLDDSSAEVGPEDQTTELLITFDRGPLFSKALRYPTKKIKIFYELNQQDKIKTCSLIPLQKESPYWELDELKNQLIYKGEALGISENSPEADLDINGPLLIRPIQGQLSLETCSPREQGQMISKGSRRRLFYCDSRQWRLLAP